MATRKTSQLDLLHAPPPQIGEVEARMWPQAAPGGWRLGHDGWEGGADTLPPLVGIDEAGRGPLAGPVSVAAVILDPAQIARAARGEGPLAGLNDSKKLTEARRAALFGPIQELAAAWAIVHLHHGHIDAVNILQATFHGMALAAGLALGLEAPAWRGAPPIKHSQGPCAPLWYPEALGPEGVQGAIHARCVAAPARVASATLLVDGDKRFVAPGAAAAGLPQQALVKGDARAWHIAAASVLAKVSRDAMMERCGALWPGYGLEVHKGYPTPTHKEAVTRLGPSPIHRLSFRGSR